MKLLFGIALLIVGIVWTRNNIRRFKKDKANYVIESVFDLFMYAFSEIFIAVIVTCLGFGLIISSFN